RRGATDVPSSCPPSNRAPYLLAWRRAGGRGADVGALYRIADFFKHVLLSVSVCAAAVAGTASPQPNAFFNSTSACKCDGHDSGPCLQYGSQLHDEHELAVLLARHNGELPRSDGGADRAEFRFRSGRNSSSSRDDSRFRSSLDADNR